MGLSELKATLDNSSITGELRKFEVYLPRVAGAVSPPDLASLPRPPITSILRQQSAGGSDGRVPITVPS